LPKTNFQSVDEYIAAQPPATQPTLQRVREAIRKALPKAEEGISYQMPEYKLNGRMVLYFAGYKKHYAIYPASSQLIAALPELAARIHSKATIRFSYDEKFPVALIARIAKLRAKEAAAAQ